MHIGIIGAGSLGLLWAARLAAHAKVTLLCRTEQQAAIINQEGIMLTHCNGYEQRYWVTATQIDFIDRAAHFDVLFLMVKQPALPQILPHIHALMQSHSVIVAWQNGLGHEEYLQSYPAFAAVTTEGARREAANRVTHTGEGYVRIGRLCGQPHLPALQTLLQPFGVEFVHNIQQAMWEKFALNVVINPLTAILEVTNGKLLEETIAPVIERLLSEVCTVAEARGIHLQQHMLRQQIADVCRKTASNHSSMLQDIQARRQTEIQSLNGQLLAYAEQMNLFVPAHAMLTALIQAKEKHRRAGST
jgi:2-dehydropantoate 2-reductase